MRSWLWVGELLQQLQPIPSAIFLRDPSCPSFFKCPQCRCHLCMTRGELSEVYAEKGRWELVAATCYVCLDV